MLTSASTWCALSGGWMAAQGTVCSPMHASATRSKSASHSQAQSAAAVQPPALVNTMLTSASTWCALSGGWMAAQGTVCSSMHASATRSKSASHSQAQSAAAVQPPAVVNAMLTSASTWCALSGGWMAAQGTVCSPMHASATRSKSASHSQAQSAAAVHPWPGV